jgi:hypothetical protein
VPDQAVAPEALALADEVWASLGEMAGRWAGVGAMGSRAP